MIKKNSLLFFRQILSVFVWHLTGKILSFEFNAGWNPLMAKLPNQECNASLGFHGQPLLNFKTDGFDLMGLDRG